MQLFKITCEDGKILHINISQITALISQDGTFRVKLSDNNYTNISEEEYKLLIKLGDNQ